MSGVGSRHVRHGKGQVKFILAQIIRGFPVFQPGQLQGEIALPVSQVYQLEAAVSSCLFPHRLQPQGLVVEGQTPFQVQHVEIEMIKSKHTGAPFSCPFQFTIRPAACQPAGKP